MLNYFCNQFQVFVLLLYSFYRHTLLIKGLQCVDTELLNLLLQPLSHHVTVYSRSLVDTKDLYNINFNVIQRTKRLLINGLSVGFASVAMVSSAVIVAMDAVATYF